MATGSIQTVPMAKEQARSIPSLDGLRAFSILTVILGHSVWFMPEWIRGNTLYVNCLGNSRLGVTTFFIISGFLITNLLLREMDKTGTISLRHFYFRRSMRIFPAFYVYVLVVVVLWALHRAEMDRTSLLASITYTWCYVPQAKALLVQHSWSLSIEEQFYLFWPALMVWLHRRDRIIEASLALIVLMPIVRLYFYFTHPALRGLDYYLIYGWLDTMMVGCLLALANRRASFQQWKRRWMRPWLGLLCGLVGFYLNPLLVLHLHKPWQGLYMLVGAPLVTAVSIAGFLLYVVEHRESMAGRVLNQRWIMRIGMLSYSLYLWQQMFVPGERHDLPWGWLWMVLAAVASYYLVEQPFLRLRAWLETRRGQMPARS